MEFVIGLLVLVALLVILDLAALKWGQNSRQSEWFNGGYDPRHEWNSANGR